MNKNNNSTIKFTS